MAGSNSDPRNCPKKQSKCHLTRLTFVLISFEFLVFFILPVNVVKALEGSRRWQQKSMSSDPPNRPDGSG
jgi:hypothetical protein